MRRAKKKSDLEMELFVVPCILSVVVYYVANNLIQFTYSVVQKYSLFSQSIQEMIFTRKTVFYRVETAFVCSALCQ